MSGNELTPLFAAQLASDVYLVKNDIGLRTLKAAYKRTMEVDGDSVVTGKTGAFTVVKKRQAMALFTLGKDVYKGHAFVAFKGTASLYDALTDLNTGIKPSHTGCKVHQGFYYALDSMMRDLQSFIISLKGVHTVHCVGHSLGGAIATLAADWIKTSGKSSEVKLYTFGSPRVGLDMFARKCTSSLNVENIYRVYRQTDPVPTLPTWPFYHVPAAGADYALWSSVAIVPPWEYHMMEHYISSADATGSWEAIKTNRPKAFLDSAVERWLKSDGLLTLTANTLELLSASLMYVLKKAANVAGIVAVGGFATTSTLMDQMAILLAKAAKLKLEVSGWVYCLVKKMAALTGLVVKEGTSLTIAFIRMVFMRVHQKVSELIWHAGRKV